MDDEKHLVQVIEFQSPTTPKPPTKVDWREHGVISPVEDQGLCGFCWAFATAGVIESHFAIKYGKLIKLSKQYLVDCDFYNTGCYGGWPYDALRHVKKHGIPTERNYPYVGKRAQVCNYNGPMVETEVSGIVGVRRDERKLVRMLAFHGPAAALVDSTSGCDWSLYHGGVFDDPGCFRSIDHAVLVVGYDLKKQYWIVKNSWGKGWGENGYIKLRMGVNMCGISGDPLAPLLV